MTLQRPAAARHRLRRTTGDRRGAILVLVAVLIPVIAMMAAFAVDVAWMQLVRTELRTATDAAARAGAKSLSLDQDTGVARAAAIAAAARNQVAGASMLVGPGDVQFGSSLQTGGDNSKFEFTAGAGLTNAVRVDGRRTEGSAAGPVGLFFGRLMGVNQFEPTHVATSTILDRDIVLVIDRSGSMGLDLFVQGDRNGQNCGPLDPSTRFVALANAVDAFIAELADTLPNEQLALASYSSSGSIRCGRNRLRFETADVRQELSTDYSLTQAEMASFVENGIGGRTAIGAGLRAGIEEITSDRARPFAVKTIVLMTDGIHNTGVDPRTVAEEAAAEDITVHTVTFSAGADQDRMQATAAITGGEHFHADTAADLAAVFREIARTLPVLLTE